MDCTPLLEPLRELELDISRTVLEACQAQSAEDLSRVDGYEGDTIYAIDRISEDRIVELFDSRIATIDPIVLIAEGLEGGSICLPRGIEESEAKWRVICDPIDGTRGLMHQKRSAWILVGVAPNRGSETRLSDIELAVQTEIPLLKQHLFDAAWAIRGRGAFAERRNRLDGTIEPLDLRPSTARDLLHGFATFVRYFPGIRDLISDIDEDVLRDVSIPMGRGETASFEDQYISSAGQLMELMCGRDRFIADLRPLFHEQAKARGLARSVCSHPYDLATELIAREAGCRVTSPEGKPLDAVLDVETDVAWVGYANGELQTELQPRIVEALQRRQLL